MNPDSFKGKILLQIVDKVILGLLVTLVVLVIQNQIDKQERFLNQALSVSKIKAEYLLTQNDRLAETMSDYLILVNKMKTTSIKKDTDIIRLYELESNATLLSALITQGGSDNLTRKRNDLLGEIASLNQKLEQNEPLGDVEPKISAVLSGYADFLSQVQAHVIDNAKDEFSRIPTGFLWWD